jgi:hypothetical protein
MTIEIPESLVWCSVDGASGVSGVARWRGDQLLEVEAVKGLGWDVWGWYLTGTKGLVLEDGYLGHGKSRRTALVLADARGQIKGFAKTAGAEIWTAYQPAVWRKLVGVSTAASRRVQKQEAVAKCRWLAADPATRPRSRSGRWDGYHLAAVAGASEDCCEATLIGLAYLVECERATTRSATQGATSAAS